MHRKLIHIVVAAALCGAGTLALASTQAPEPVEILEGKDHPILLARVVVTATPLDDQAAGPAHPRGEISGGR